MDIYQEIKGLIKKACEKAGLPEFDFNIDHPNSLEFGDISTNVALLGAKEVSLSAKELAEKLVSLIDPHPFVKSVSVAGPGFINFHLSLEFFNQNLSETTSAGSNYGKNKKLEGQKIIVEYTDPNPFKVFHIGHVMTNTVGEAISRLLENSGAEVKRACYQGDVGVHVAQAVWAMMKNDINPESVEDLGRAYALGSKQYKESEQAKKEINEINKKIYDKSDSEVNDIYNSGRETSLKSFDEIYKILGTDFDYFFFESEVSDFGRDLVEKNIGSVFEKSEGAIIYNGEKDGLHTRVFINKDGLPTYEAKELGLAKVKHDKYPYDKSIVVTGNDILEYFKVLLAVMSKIYPDLAKKTKHITNGMLRLPSGKMSSRTGDVVSAESLIDEVKGNINEKMSDREIESKEKTLEEIAIGAIKYSILKQEISKDVIFDFENSVSFDGNSGPYLQYTFVRTNSVLEKAGNKKGEGKRPEGVCDLERLIYRFPLITDRAEEDFAPQYIATYLHQIAKEYNSLYAKEKFIGSEHEDFFVDLSQTVGIIIKNGLNILGIKTPTKM